MFKSTAHAECFNNLLLALDDARVRASAISAYLYDPKTPRITEAQREGFNAASRSHLEESLSSHVNDQRILERNAFILFRFRNPGSSYSQRSRLYDPEVEKLPSQEVPEEVLQGHKSVNSLVL